MYQLRNLDLETQAIESSSLADIVLRAKEEPVVEISKSRNSNEEVLKDKSLNGVSLSMNIVERSDAFNSSSTNYNLLFDTLKSNNQLVKIGATYSKVERFSSKNTIPFISSNGDVCYWVNEDDDVTSDAGLTTGGVYYSAKTIATKIRITRKLLKLSPKDLEMVITEALSKSLKTGVADSALTGDTLQNQTDGLINVLSQKITDAGTQEIDKLSEAIRMLDQAGFDTEKLGVVACPLSKEAYMKKDTTNGKAWKYGDKASQTGQSLYNLAATTNNTLPKGTVIIGDWSQLAILTAPSIDFTAIRTGASGAVDLYAFYDVDTTPLNEKAFVVISGVVA